MRLLNQAEVIVHSTSQHNTWWTDQKLVRKQQVINKHNWQITGLKEKNGWPPLLHSPARVSLVSNNVQFTIPGFRHQSPRRSLLVLLAFQVKQVDVYSGADCRPRRELQLPVKHMWRCPTFHVCTHNLHVFAFTQPTQALHQQKQRFSSAGRSSDEYQPLWFIQRVDLLGMEHDVYWSESAGCLPDPLPQGAKFRRLGQEGDDGTMHLYWSRRATESETDGGQGMWRVYSNLPTADLLQRESWKPSEAPDDLPGEGEKGPCRSDWQWICCKGNVAGTSERQGGAHRPVDFPNE